MPYVPDEWQPLLERGRIDVGEGPGRPRVRLAGTGPGNIEWLEAVSSNRIKREEIGERHNRIGYDMMVACLDQGGPLQGRPDSIGRKNRRVFGARPGPAPATGAGRRGGAMGGLGTGSPIQQEKNRCQHIVAPGQRGAQAAAPGGVSLVGLPPHPKQDNSLWDETPQLAAIK